jgi:hypothetical protein
MVMANLGNNVAIRRIAYQRLVNDQLTHPRPRQAGTGTN